METTVADYIASQLFKAGVRYVFGIPGGPSIPYIEAFSKAGIRFILVSNEAAAGIMADVTSRITGIPGICHATFGPGAANISTGIGGALLDRSAVIVLTSEMDDDFIHRTAQMNISHQKLFEPITKATFRVDENNVAEILERSLSICKTEYPGPVHLGLPAGTALKEVISSNDGAVKFERRKYHQAKCPGNNESPHQHGGRQCGEPRADAKVVGQNVGSPDHRQGDDQPNRTPEKLPELHEENSIIRDGQDRVDAKRGVLKQGRSQFSNGVKSNARQPDGH